MNMFVRQRIKSPEYHHMICIGKTKCTSEEGLLAGSRSKYGKSRTILDLARENLACELVFGQI